MSVTRFLDEHFRHFNARELVAAARAWNEHLDAGGKMFLAMAGAMSTAEIGRSLSPLIRAGKVHGISATAANLEEDIFNLVAHDDYRMVPNYRDLSPADEQELCEQGFNRVTDTCIPETVMRAIERRLTEYWSEAAATGSSYFPHELFYKLIDEGHLERVAQMPLEHSWVVAAHEMNLPIYTPGWEDSTLGNIFTARVIDGTVSNHLAIKTGTMQLEHLARWYEETDRTSRIGFFQIGGGIAGDFPICAVPMLIQDLERDVRHWGYFCQISDSTTSYGSYSGAVPNEKITWHKLDAEGPKFMINSDASIVAPLIFAHLLGW
ncbi:MAG: deoxyhypusine synthase family protein [Pirellulales bacterium]|nr:deoxyhypusine synthase family protein [Pirellulales bacterium]